MLRAVLLPPAHPLAPAPLGPASLGFLSPHPPVQPFLVIVGQTPSMTHPGLGFLVPAVLPTTPDFLLLGAPQARSSGPSPCWVAAKSPASLGGRSKKEGAGTLPASGTTHVFVPM